MLRAPVLMRSVRGGQGQRAPSLIKKNEYSRCSSHPATRSSYSNKNTKLESCSSLHNSTNKPGTRHDKEELVLGIKFRVKMLENNGACEEDVYFKDDEDRFTQRYTLKLRTHVLYKISIEVESGKQVSYLKLGGILLDQFLLCQPNPGDESTRLVHTFIWCTDKMNATKKKCRTILPCVLKLQDHEEVCFVAMVKFYKQNKVNHTKGHPLSFLSFDSSDGNVRKEGHFQQLMFNQHPSELN